MMAVKTYSYKKHKNKSLSKHFSVGEFVSNVAGKVNYDTIKTDTSFISKLEKLFNYNIYPIRIISGYRHPKDSVAVGGSSDDAHTKGIAADIIAYKDGKPIPSKYLSCLCELIGFSGIGIISSTSVHIDIRNNKNYKNSHWFGDERNGNNYIKSFFDYNNISKAELFGYLDYYKEKCYYIRAVEKTPIRYEPNSKAKIKKHYEKNKKARIFAEKGKYGKVLSGWIELSKTKRG